jgi:hypothetical protein
VSELRLKEGFDSRADAIDDRAQVARLRFGALLQLFDGRQNGAAARVPEHDNEPRAESRRRELDASYLGGSDDIAGHANDEEITETLVEHDLDGHTRIGAAKDDRERLLVLGQLEWARLTKGRFAGLDAGDETAVALAQARERVVWWYHRGAWGLWRFGRR